MTPPKAAAPSPPADALSPPPPFPPGATVGDWEAAGAQFFSRELLYDMQWGDIDLETKRWAVGGGMGDGGGVESKETRGS